MQYILYVHYSALCFLHFLHFVAFALCNNNNFESNQGYNKGHIWNPTLLRGEILNLLTQIADCTLVQCTQLTGPCDSVALASVNPLCLKADVKIWNCIQKSNIVDQ